MTNILLGIIALELLAIFSKLDKLEERGRENGNDRKGDKSKVRYATIGFVAEYGTSSHVARPYMTVANEKAHEKVVEAQRSIWESETGE